MVSQASAAAVSAITVWVTKSRLRRSTASAKAPPSREKNDDRQDARQPNPAQGDRLVGQGADVPEQRPGLHLGAGNGDGQPNPQVAETAVDTGREGYAGSSGQHITLPPSTLIACPVR